MKRMLSPSCERIGFTLWLLAIAIFWGLNAFGQQNQGRMDSLPPSLIAQTLSSTHSAHSTQRGLDILRAIDAREVALLTSPSFMFQSAESSEGLPYPITNRIHLIRKGIQDVWLMRQKQKESDGDNPAKWSFFAIVLDRTQTPPVSHYFELAPEAPEKKTWPKVLEPSAPCLRCHSNGPRVIRPLQSQIGEKAKLMEQWNDSIAKIGLVSHAGAKGLSGKGTQDALPFGACTQCHNSSGIRTALHRENITSIQFLVNHRHMPLEEPPLKPFEKTCLEAWLEERPMTPECVAYSRQQHTQSRVIGNERERGSGEDNDLEKGLLARVATTLGAFEVRGLHAAVRVRCGDRSNCRVRGQIHTALLKTGIGLRDQHLMSAFAPLNHRIELESEVFTFPKGDEVGKVFSVAVTLKNAKKVQTVPVRLQCSGTRCTLQKFDLSLKDLGITPPSFFGMTVQDYVHIWGTVDFRWE